MFGLSLPVFIVLSIIALIVLAFCLYTVKGIVKEIIPW